MGEASGELREISNWIVEEFLTTKARAEHALDRARALGAKVKKGGHTEKVLLAAIEDEIIRAIDDDRGACE